MGTQKKNNWFLKLGLSCLVLIMIYVLTFLVNPYNLYWVESFSENKTLFFGELALSFLFSLCIIETSILIAKFLELRIPWAIFPIRRSIFQTILIIIAVMLLIYLQILLFGSLYDDAKLTKDEMLAGWQFVVVSAITALFVSAVHTGFSLLKKWKATITEASDLRIKALEFKELAMQAELESLKIQLNPHFMFNNFSTLGELIAEDTVTANKFLENLSRVYRYMIQNLKKNTITLKEEIAFVKAYFYLLEIRHGNNIRLEVNLDKEVLKLNIPPISLQLLVENAIKHNIATSDQPLTIKIVSVENKYLNISNSLQRISTPFPSVGIGLQNIKNRYRILSEKDLPVISETGSEFSVTLPLFNSNTESYENIDN